MLIQDSSNVPEHYLENWPAHYFEIEDIGLRQKILLEQTQKHPERKEDLERLKLLNLRFRIKTGAAWADRFMHAWLMLRVLKDQKTNRFNARKQQEHLRAELVNLCVLDYEYSEVLQEEWQDFAYRYILACGDSRNYRTAILGFLPMKDDAIAIKILREIDALTGELPGRFGFADDCVHLRTAMISTYGRMIKNAEEYLAQVFPEGKNL